MKHRKPTHTTHAQTAKFWQAALRLVVAPENRVVEKFALFAVSSGRDTTETFSINHATNQITLSNFILSDAKGTTVRLDTGQPSVLWDITLPVTNCVISISSKKDIYANQ